MNKIIAAGILFWCKNTQRFLIAERSDKVSEPNTISSIAGKMEDFDLNPLICAMREVTEECKLSPTKLDELLNTGIIEYYIDGPIYNSNDLKFYNFICITNEEFPVNCDTEENNWIQWKSVPELINLKPNFHFGLDFLFKNILKIN